MNGLFRNLLAVAAGAMIIPGAQAALIAEWQFNKYSGGNLSNFLPDYGNQSSTATANSTSGGNASRIAGTSINEYTANSPNYAITMPSGNGSSTANSVLTLKITGTGLSHFVINYASQDNDNTGYTQTWAWSTDNLTYNSITPTVNAANGTWTSYTVDFGSVTAINGAANVWFRDTITFNGNKQTVSFDNISIQNLSTVPEPVHYALAVFGLVFVGTGAGRWCARRMKHA